MLNIKSSRYPSTWTSTNVQALFRPSNDTTSAVPSQTSIPSQTSVALRSPSASSTSFPTSNPHVGKGSIAGIAIGCIVALILSIGGIALTLNRRKKEGKARWPLATATLEYRQSTRKAAPLTELLAVDAPLEMSGNRYLGAELASDTRHPLETSGNKYLRAELPADTRYT